MKNLVSAKPLGKISLFVNSPGTSSWNSTRFLLQISHFSNFSPSNAVSASYSSRRQEEGIRNVRVSVWWDIENCPVPVSANVFRVTQCITAAIRANGIKGPIHITAFGDVTTISRPNQEALSSTGINLTHIPRGGKNSADRSLLVDLMCWVSQNPPPAHLFLISGDRDFAGILHRLRMNNYNILLASPESAPTVLCSAASIMWHWNSLLKEENLQGKHFNQPPDGPYGSWYGHYRVPLEDPFAVAEAPVFSQVENSPDSAPDKVRPIPKKIIEQIRHILHSYPKGIPITDLRAELTKNNINFKKASYGYKKFSCFLLATQVLKLQQESNGQHLVFGVPPKGLEQDEHTPGVTTEPVQNGKEHFVPTSRLNVEKSSYIENIEEKPTVSLASETSINHANKQPFFLAEVQKSPQQMPVILSPEPKLETTPANSQDNNVHDKPQEVQESPALIQGVEGAESTQAHLVKYYPVSEPGFFRKMWRKWFGHEDGALQEKSGTTSTISPEKLECKEDLNSTMQQVESVIQTPFSSSSNETGTNDINLKTAIADNEKSRKSTSFLNQIMRFWRGSAISDDISETLKEIPDQIEPDSENGIFGKESFWNEVQAFIGSPDGLVVVNLSKTRAQIAEKFREQGPQSLRSFSGADLLHLVNLIISDKKWIEESPSKNYPFRVIPFEMELSFSSPSGSDAFQKLKELHRHRRFQNPPDAGAPYPIVDGNIFRKSRNETVLDCQKLIDEYLKEHPEGFNMGNFRRMFHGKYGYPLDLQKLGYEKLATFLQTMSGVTVESTHLIPSHNQKSQNLESKVGDTESHSESELSDGSRKKDDDLDSPWEELGPLSNLALKKRETQSGPSRKMKDGAKEKIQHEYESLSDDDFSDTEEMTSPEITSESKKKAPVNEADSSLLQILDSWYKTKDDENKPSGSEDIDAAATSGAGAGAGADADVDSSQSGSSESAVKNETPAKTNGRKQRHPRSYSFVTEHHVDNKDRFIDGILGSLKKTSERC